MTVYNPNIPQPGDIPAQSQDQILQNFQSLNNAQNKDHVPLSNTVSRGLHNKCTFPAQAPVPVSSAGQGILYSLTAIPGQTVLAYNHDGGAPNDVALTGPFSINNSGPPTTPATSSGYTFLGGSLLLQWGFTTSTTVVFPYTFVFDPVSITVTARRAASSPGSTDAWVSTTGTSGAGFQIFNSGGHTFDGWYWMAIGRWV